MAYFATPYTIHFDDTMAYGSHHFMTAFKFQCAARESLLYGDLIFDRKGVREALDGIHLLTADAYSRNLGPTFLGDRVAILITLEEWGRVSARFCYRVLGQEGTPICAGFQTMICTDATSALPIPLPEPLRQAFDALREITEAEAEKPFRDRVLTGSEATEQLFPESIRQLCREYLRDRYPHPRVIASSPETPAQPTISVAPPERAEPAEVWVFPGQGAFDAALLSERIVACTARWPELRQEWDRCAEIAARHIGGDAAGVVSGTADRCRQAVRETPELSQVAIHLQSVLGARIREQACQPALLMGHSFGELAALNVAGCYDLPTGIEIVCARVRAIQEHAPPRGGLLVATTNRSMVAEEIAVLGLLDVVIAGRNHEQQTVVSGPEPSLDRLREQLRKKHIEAIRIASPTSFHHPALRGAAVAWLNRLRELPIKPPGRKIFSPIGRRELTIDDDLATVLCSQFIRPFDLQGALDDLHAGGFRDFVDCGSSGPLARLLETAGPKSIHVLRVDGAAAGGTEHVKKQCDARPEPLPATSIAKATDDSRPVPAVASATADRVPSRPTIAIVSQGCLLPGRSHSPLALHAAIREGRLGIFDQRQRDPHWERDFFSATLLPDRSTSPLAGLVDDGDLTPPESFDPQRFARFSRAQKLLCVALAQCRPAIERGDRVLCLIGTTADGFQDQDRYAALRYAGIDPTDAEVAARVGGTHGWNQDPYAAVREVLDHLLPGDFRLTLVDAACASSLYTVALGMRSLEHFESDLVLAGGVYCPGPGNNCLFSQFGGLSATGCRPFDATADGVVFSEGAAFVALRREADARGRRQPVQAVVRGAGLSSDGRSSSANVPQSGGQILALRRCYTRYAIPPASVVAIEGHGTSTSVGDNTELQTLSKFFAEHTTSPIPLHSLKGCLGHTGWAAGTASIIAACETLRTGIFPAQAFHQKPSSTLLRAEKVLRVPTSPVSLTMPQRRMAIDGFGFGGANAHVVVDACSSTETLAEASAAQSNEAADETDELVLVAWHQVEPTIQDAAPHARTVARFDRRAISLPLGVVLLPDLADDMDLSQILAISLVGETLAKIAAMSDDDRQQTGIVLAFGGKTERAVEATARVLAPRLTRDLAGHSAATTMQKAADAARPSGTYTLQCMMPNVAAGRAALQFNLKGPNFVVDAGGNSLEAAFSSASLLLRGGKESGTNFVLVLAIHANRWSVPGSDADQARSEYAAAFAVTTRSRAQAMGLEGIIPLASLSTTAYGNGTSTQEKVASLVASLRDKGRKPVRTAADERDEFPIHAPVWIEAPLAPKPDDPRGAGDERWLLVLANDALLPELRSILPQLNHRSLIARVGSSPPPHTNGHGGPQVIRVQMEDDDARASALAAIRDFAPDVVIGLDRPIGWDLPDVLGQVSQNDLCEALFLISQALVPRLKQGATEIWGVFPGGWKGVIHPGTGAVTGFIKSTAREFPSAPMGILSASAPSLREALQGLQRERRCGKHRESEIVHDGDVRLVRRLRRVHSAALSGKLPRPQVALTRDSVVIATGGARGVTAVLAEALLRDCGCHIIAWGRSPLEEGPADHDSPQAEQAYYAQFLRENPGATARRMKESFESARARWEATRTIAQLAQLGGHIRYMNVDVANPESVETAISQIIAEFGRVDWILHGAGIQWSKKLEDRTLAEFQRTFAVKVAGLRYVIESCRKHLGRIVPAHLLTSAYSIFGNDGQPDYGAANETLDRLCGLATLSPGYGWSSIAWSAWDAIGMTRGSEYKALAERRNLALLGPAAGQRVFRSVMEGRTSAEINVPLADSERARYCVRTVPRSRVINAQRVCEFAVDLKTVDCLAFHQARGVPTLPGAWILDYMVRAALPLVESPIRYLMVEDMRFHRFIRCGTGHDPDIRVVVEGTPAGYSAWMIGNILNPDGIVLASDEVFTTAALSTPFQSSLPRPSLNGLSGGNGSIRTVTDPYCGDQQIVQLSGPFNCLHDIQISDLGRKALFGPGQRGHWDGITPALLLDASLRVAGMHVVPDALHVPTRIDRAVIPVGMTTDSFDAHGWRIRTCPPRVHGDNIHCERIEVTDDAGNLRLYVEGAVVTQLR